jgi:hypothetical protein
MIRRMRRTLVATWVASGLCAGLAVAANENTTIVLHAQPIGDVVNCSQWIGNVDCSPVLPPPTVNVGAGEYLLVHIFLRNYEDVGALYCRFAVDGGEGAQTWGDWTFLASNLSCLPGQTGNGPGVLNGSMNTGFYCITGGELRLLGYLFVITGSSGCLGIEEHDVGTSGTVVLDCGVGAPIPIAPQNRGRICVGTGGYNACDPRAVPVENTTWGNIKRQLTAVAYTSSPTARMSASAFPRSTTPGRMR